MGVAIDLWVLLTKCQTITFITTSSEKQSCLATDSEKIDWLYKTNLEEILSPFNLYVTAMQKLQMLCPDKISVSRKASIIMKSFYSKWHTKMHQIAWYCFKAYSLTSLWPARYLVAELRTRSAPKASACWFTGVANVPSMQTSTPWVWHSFETNSTSIHRK